MSRLRRFEALVLSLAFCAMGALAQAPRIDSVTPSQGPITGGTVVTISGANLGGAAIALDGAPISAISASATQVRLTAPARDSGIASLSIATAAGTAYGEFLYLPPRLADLPPGHITTVAGIGKFNGEFRHATQAEISPQGSPAFDTQGNLYIPEPQNNRIVRVRADGILEPFAGNGRSHFQAQQVGDGGPAAQALVNFPRGVTADNAGNVYIAESAPRVRKVDTRTGLITTIAGTGAPGFSGDGGPATQARLNEATHITGDRAGTVWFIDFDNASRAGRIRRVAPDGIITTVAGTATPGFSGDGGPATAAQFAFLSNDYGSLARDPQGNIYVLDYGNARVRKIDALSGVITTFHGPVPASDGPATAIASDSSGNLYVALSRVIVKLDSAGRTVATYGNNRFGGHSPDGTAISDTYLNLVNGLTTDATDNVVYIDQAIPRARKFNFATAMVETLAGMAPDFIGETGPATATVVRTSGGARLAIQPNGDLLIGDGHAVIRRVDTAGNISTFANGGLRAAIAGTRTPFVDPLSIVPDGAGGIYVADTWNVLRIDAQGNTSLAAGTFHTCGFSGDGGPATAAELCQPWDVARDSLGNLFIADTNNNRIRRIDGRTGIITTVAGSGPTNGFERYRQSGGYSGDGEPATQARLNTPQALLIDANDNLLIADSGNFRIRKVDRNGVITTIVDGNGAIRMTMDAAGVLFTAGGTNRGDDPAFGIRRVNTATGTSTLLTVASVPGGGGIGDGGPATQARTAIAQSPGIAIDRDGNLYFADSENQRIRAIRGAATPSSSPANHTALWWNPAESGWGLNVNHQGDIAFATLFTYDPAGNPMWLVMSAGARQGTADTFAGELYRTTGPAFSANPFTPIGASNVTRVGTMTLTFTGDAGTLAYSFNGINVTKSIQKQQFGTRIATCQATTADRAALTNYQDLWWNAAESGWGLNVTHQVDTLFATLFTYDTGGQGLWLVMSAGARQTDGSYLGDLYRTTGPAFNAQPFTPITTANVTRVGSMALRFPSGTSGSLTYSVNGVNVTKAITRQQFSAPLPACS